MALRDALRSLAGAAGTALTALAVDPLQKAPKISPDPEEGAGAVDDDPEGESQAHGPGGADEDTATSSPVPTDKATGEPKSLFWDPFAIVEQLGYRERRTSVTYATLRSILRRMPIIQAIIQTRINQVAAFGNPVRDRYDAGFRVKLRDRDQEPTDADKRWCEQMTLVLRRTGVTDNPRGRDGFDAFLRKLTYDSLVYDQACFETVPNRKGEPVEWYAIDASTIRLADSSSAFLDEDKTKAVRYVQVYDGAVIAEYNQEELWFGVRNPRTDIRLYGYGESELEMLITTITAMLWAWDYNRNAFAQGSVQKGLLNFKGAIPERQMKAFRRHWYTMLAGVENAWKTPILNADDVQWVGMQTSNRDMEYNAWMDFLIKVACSMFLIDPIEVNFKYGSTGQRAAMAETSNREKILESKERGLKPLLRFLERAINQYIIWPVNENFEFAFEGLDQVTRDQLTDRNMKLVKSTRTINELRAEDDLPPLDGKVGDMILDPVFWQAKQAFDAQEQEGAQGGAAGGGFGESPPTDWSSWLRDEDEEAGPSDAAEPEPASDDAAAAAVGGAVAPGPDQEPDRVPVATQKSLSGSRRRIVVDVKL